LSTEKRGVHKGSKWIMGKCRAFARRGVRLPSWKRRQRCRPQGGGEWCRRGVTPRGEESIAVKEKRHLLRMLAIFGAKKLIRDWGEAVEGTEQNKIKTGRLKAGNGEYRGAVNATEKKGEGARFR